MHADHASAAGAHVNERHKGSELAHHPGSWPLAPGPWPLAQLALPRDALDGQREGPTAAHRHGPSADLCACSHPSMRTCACVCTRAFVCMHAQGAYLDATVFVRRPEHGIDLELLPPRRVGQRGVVQLGEQMWGKGDWVRHPGRLRQHLTPCLPEGVTVTDGFGCGESIEQLRGQREVTLGRCIPRRARPAVQLTRQAQREWNGEHRLASLHGLAHHKEAALAAA